MAQQVRPARAVTTIPQQQQPRGAAVTTLPQVIRGQVLPRVVLASRTPATPPVRSRPASPLVVYTATTPGTVVVRPSSPAVQGLLILLCSLVRHVVCATDLFIVFNVKSLCIHTSYNNILITEW